jgi:hypothetical protein
MAKPEPSDSAENRAEEGRGGTPHPATSGRGYRPHRGDVGRPYNTLRMGAWKS